MQVNTVGDVALALGVSERTVYTYLKRGAPGEKGGVYDVEAIDAWRRANMAERSQVAKSDLQEALKRAELEKTLEQAREKRLKNDLLEGQLVYRDEVIQVWNENLRRIVSRFESFAEECSIVLPADIRQQVTHEIDNKVHLMLKEMSTWEPPGESSTSEP